MCAHSQKRAFGNENCASELPNATFSPKFDFLNIVENVYIIRTKGIITSIRAKSSILTYVNVLYLPHVAMMHHFIDACLREISSLSPRTLYDCYITREQRNQLQACKDREIHQNEVNFNISYIKRFKLFSFQSVLYLQFPAITIFSADVRNGLRR